jgi:4-hydroxybenzoate polyprenyltransferase/geranylgeranylglycerol-phosphate geranylgeranyltransferase
MITRSFAHLETMRPYTLFYSGMLAIAGAEVASGGTISGVRLALAAIASMAGWEAGLYASDYYDRDRDATAKPLRPIPSGRISPREAFGTMLLLIALGYVLSLLLGPANLALAIFTTALGIAYSRTFKSKALLGNFDRGVLGLCAVAFGALAGGSLTRPAVIAVMALALLHDSGTNLVGAMRDVDGDRAANCPTVPVVYGLRRSLDIALSLAAGGYLAAVAALLLLRAGIVPWLLLGVAAWVLLGVAALLALSAYLPMWRTRANIIRRVALDAHKRLVFERLVIIAAIIAAAGAVGLSLVLLAITAIATQASQSLLRDRHEREAAGPAPASSSRQPA